MTLDEAIKHEEEVAEEKDMQAGFDTDYLCYQMSDTERNQCKKCAEEHRQLAEWLKDYRRLLEQQPCDDCVSRQAVLEFLKGFEILHNHDELRSNLIYGIMDMPPVMTEPKMGRWMRKTKVEGVYDIAGIKTWGVKCQCEKCDFTTTVIEDFGYYNYCPNCGAKMQEVEE